MLQMILFVYLVQGLFYKRMSHALNSKPGKKPTMAGEAVDLGVKTSYFFFFFAKSSSW